MLTEYQIGVIKELFFPKNILNSYRLNLIIDHLIEKEMCLADRESGDILISMGGVGNFIFYKHSENGVGIVNLTMNREYFFNSEFFQERLQIHHNEKIKEVEKVQQEYKELSMLVK